MYADLNYASSTSDFRADKSNYEDYGRWIRFDQTEFLDHTQWSFSDTDFSANGYVYIPNSCSY